MQGAGFENLCPCPTPELLEGEGYDAESTES